MSVVSGSLQRLFNVVDSLVDERVGLIEFVREVRVEAGAPDFFHFSARACNARAFSQLQNSRTAGGASADRGIAMAKAIGEAVERYCSALYVVEELPLTTFESAPFSCTHPTEFALYSEQQYASPNFPFVPFESHTPVRWAPARNAVTGEVQYVPAAMAYVPYHYDPGSGEFPIAQPISTGLACHCSWEEAALSAICEVVERDAFTITWQALLARPHIRIETLCDKNRDLVARFERTGGSVTLLVLAMDHGIPTILAVLRGTAADAPAFVFAASAHPGPEEAARKSLEELAHTRALASHLKSVLPPLVPSPDYDNIVTADDHVRLYCDQANAPPAEFVLSSNASIDFRDIQNLAVGIPEQDLETTVQRIHAAGHRVLLADLTSPDVAELGLFVVRAIIPGFHPLAIGHSRRALGGFRLWEVPWRLGYTGVSRESGDNPAPHPYP